MKGPRHFIKRRPAVHDAGDQGADPPMPLTQQAGGRKGAPGCDRGTRSAAGGAMIDRLEPHVLTTTVGKLHISLSRSVNLLTRTAAPAAVHDARIAIRRLRIALHCLNAQLIPSLGKRYKSALRQLAQDLEVVREADARVLAVNTLIERYNTVDRKEAREVLAVAHRERTHSRRLLRRSIQSIAWRERVAELARYAEHGLTVDESKDAILTIRNDFTRRRQHLRRTLRDIAHKPRRLHCLRLQVKDLRYLTENFLQSPTSGHVMRLKRLRQLQNRLGEFHDNWRLKKWLRTHFRGQPIANSWSALIKRRQTRLLRHVRRLARKYRTK